MPVVPAAETQQGLFSKTKLSNEITPFYYCTNICRRRSIKLAILWRGDYYE